MQLSFATPLGALACLLALLPLAGFLLRDRRDGRVRALLRLAAPARSRRALAPAVVVAAVLLLGVAAARPELATAGKQSVRTDAQAYVVLDISRSMLARAHAGAPTRHQRSVAFAIRLRDRLADVPVGVATLTDRVLPHLFPTADRTSFDAVVEQATGIDRPPPRYAGLNGTDLGALNTMARDGFFQGHPRHRLVVVLTDGEAPSLGLTKAYGDGATRLMLVRVGGLGDRIYNGGRVDRGYRPDFAGLRSTAALARSLGQPLYDANDLTAVAARAHSLLGAGHVTSLPSPPHRLPLAPVAVAAAAILVGASRLRPWAPRLSAVRRRIPASR